MKNIVHTENAPKATGPFSQAVVSGDFVFTSGQIHLTVEGTLLEGNIEAQTHQVMKNLDAILKEADSTFDKVVKSTIYVTDMTNYGKINEVYGSYFSENFPAREVICVQETPYKEGGAKQTDAVRG